MSDNENELRRILSAYVELSIQNMERAIYAYKKALEQQLELYKQKCNDNSNQT